LTEGIAAALEMLLLMPNPLVEPKLVTRLWDHGPVRWKNAKGPHPWSSNMTLSPRHPLTQRIMARWESGQDEELMNIPRDRLSRPFVRHFRSSNLASEEEMAEVIVEGMGVVRGSIFCHPGAYFTAESGLDGAAANTNSLEGSPTRAYQRAILGRREGWFRPLVVTAI
jgi:hypothetical protein